MGGYTSSGIINLENKHLNPVHLDGLFLSSKKRKELKKYDNY